MWKLKVWVLTVALVVLCGHRTGAAEDQDLLQRVRLSVASYDLQEGGIIDVVGELKTFLEGAADISDNTVREVRFLRAAASADLMFIAAYTQDRKLADRLAQAWGVAGSLRDAVLAELKLADGIYRAPAARIERSLALLGPDGALRPSESAQTAGSWRDIVLLKSTVATLDSGAPPEGVMARLGEDPCAGIQGGCDSLFMTFDGDSRGALAGLRNLGQAMVRLRAARAQGDPLISALSEDIEAEYARLVRVELRLTPMLRPEMHVHAEGDKANRVVVDLLVQLHEDSLQYGYVPRMSLGQDGTLQARAIAEPALPRTESVSLPSSYRPYMHPISEVVEALRPSGIDPEALSVGLTAAPGVPSHVLGRVLLSVGQAGYSQRAMIGLGRSGGARGVPLRVVGASEVEELRPQPQVQVRVRLGGYSLRMGLGSTDIPRVRLASGLAFDTAALQDRVSRSKIRSASVSFMGDVAVENLLSAVWSVAPEGDPLHFVVP